jgi:hypothetical protein
MQVYEQPIAQVTRPNHITHLAFMLRFTPGERTGIRTSTDPDVQDMLFLVNTAKFVDLDLKLTRDGLDLLAYKGIISPERAAEIKDSPVEEHERV